MLIHRLGAPQTASIRLDLSEYIVRWALDIWSLKLNFCTSHRVRTVLLRPCSSILF